MGSQPVWCLFQVQPQDSLKVKKAFNKAVKESKIAQTLQEYLQNREDSPRTFDPEFRESMNQFIPKAFAIASDPYAYDWEDLHKTHSLFFPEEFEELIESLFASPDPIISTSISEARIDFISSDRVGAAEMLYAGLGWKRANRLPGYCGNMFIPSKELKEALIDIEQIFAEVDEEDFLAKANAVGSRGNCNEDTPSQLLEFPLAIDKALTEGNGFLALNYSHMGTLPLLDEENDEDYKLIIY